eukprot:TRINITY_DN6975_c0_g1_i1.p1 TRINITY_DN6975_c0_g1~~TRINITY_DN6975_c0_g1_i1.p1  ORF type:complete len:638 (+),score=141.30 TRINITY_DN6975_c0_g1_i1:147-2060(+)
MCIRDSTDTPRKGSPVETLRHSRPTEECLQAVSALVELFGPDNTFILSKCGTRMQQATVAYLTRGDFFSRTGLLPHHVLFCTSRSGGESLGLELVPLEAPPKGGGYPTCELRLFGEDGPRVGSHKVGKGVIAKMFELTHMIDDRQECLSSFFMEGHLGSTEPQGGALLHFGTQAQAPAEIKRAMREAGRWEQVLEMWRACRGWKQVLAVFGVDTIAMGAAGESERAGWDLLNCVGSTEALHMQLSRSGKPCRHFRTTRGCKHGARCRYMHGGEEQPAGSEEGEEPSGVYRCKDHSEYFLKYDKMPLDTMGHGGSTSAQWLATEKVHGANFCVIVDPTGRVSFGCRTRVLAEDDDFYSFRSCGLAMTLTLNAGRVMAAHLAGHEKGDGAVEAIVIYGELFGGEYPHPQVPKVPGLRPIQNGVWYSPSIEFMGFDVLLHEAQHCHDGRTHQRFLNFSEARSVCKAADILFAEPVWEGSLAECLEPSCEFESTIPQRLGLPPLDAPNLAEGCVIRMREGRGLFKRKIQQFSEVQYQHDRWKDARQGGGGRGAFEPCDGVLLVQYELEARVTDQRVAAVMSKMGPVSPKDKPRCMELLRCLVEDVLQDLDPADSEVVAATPALMKLLHEESKAAIRTHLTQ